MSHFVVLVIGDDPESQLAPFSEQDEEYMVFDDRTEEARKEYETDGTERVELASGELLPPWSKEGKKALEDKTGKEVKVPFSKMYDTFEGFCRDWHGYIQEGERWGGRHNPKAKWDWYSLGGRWMGYFKTKDPNALFKARCTNDAFAYGLEENGYECPERARTGQPAVVQLLRNDGSPAMPGDPTPLALAMKVGGKVICKCPHCRGELEPIAVMGRPGTFENASEKGHADYARNGDIDWEGMLEGMKEHRRQNFDKAMKNFDERKAKGEGDEDGLWGTMEFLWGVKKGMTREECANQAHVSTFAVLKGGEWFEKGEMGWWAMVANEKDQDKWNEEFAKLVAGLPPETPMWAFDCHI